MSGDERKKTLEALRSIAITAISLQGMIDEGTADLDYGDLRTIKNTREDLDIMLGYYQECAG